MGYYTYYKLTWKLPDVPVVECPTCGAITEDGSAIITNAIEAHLNADSGRGCIKDCLEDSCKWYEHNEDMLALSREFPDVIFTLNGEGEEAGDVWRAYYQNGRVWKQQAEITFKEFDRSKLI